MAKDKHIDRVTLIQCGPGKIATVPKIDDGKVRSIVVNFPKGVDLPPGFERVLQSLVGMVCDAYEKANPYRVMWPAGMGGQPNERAIHSDDFENMFDMSVFHIGVSERGASPRDLEDRGYTLCDTTCSKCGQQQFIPKVNELVEQGYVTCPDKHLVESGEGQGDPIVRVHILCAGKSLCGFSRLIPAEWPKHHKWISFEDTDAKKVCTCILCKKVYTKMKSGS